MLLYTTDATCFEDLRTVDGTVYASYKESAVARGVLDDDQKPHRIMEDAVAWDSPVRVRELFAMLLTLGEVQSPLDLFNTFHADLSEDFLYQARQACHSCHMPVIKTSHHLRLLCKAYLYLIRSIQSSRIIDNLGFFSTMIHTALTAGHSQHESATGQPPRPSGVAGAGRPSLQRGEVVGDIWPSHSTGWASPTFRCQNGAGSVRPGVPAGQGGNRSG